jgi:hypothetical protein
MLQTHMQKLRTCKWRYSNHTPGFIFLAHQFLKQITWMWVSVIIYLSSKKGGGNVTRFITHFEKPEWLDKCCCKSQATLFASILIQMKQCILLTRRKLLEKFTFTSSYVLDVIPVKPQPHTVPCYSPATCDNAVLSIHLKTFSDTFCNTSQANLIVTWT